MGSLDSQLDVFLEGPPFGQWKTLQDLVNVCVLEGKHFHQSLDPVLGLDELK